MAGDVASRKKASLSGYTRKEILKLIEENIGSGGRRVAKLASD